MVLCSLYHLLRIQLPLPQDFLKEKALSKLKTKVANTVAENFANELLKKNKLIIKEVRGIENLEGTIF